MKMSKILNVTQWNASACGVAFLIKHTCTYIKYELSSAVKGHLPVLGFNHVKSEKQFANFPMLSFLSSSFYSSPPNF